MNIFFVKRTTSLINGPICDICDIQLNLITDLSTQKSKNAKINWNYLNLNKKKMKMSNQPHCYFCNC